MKGSGRMMLTAKTLFMFNNVTEKITVIVVRARETVHDLDVVADHTHTFGLDTAADKYKQIDIVAETVHLKAKLKYVDKDGQQRQDLEKLITRHFPVL